MAERQESGRTSLRITDDAVVAAGNALLDAGFIDPADGTIPQWPEEDAPPWWTHPSEAVKVTLRAALPHLIPSREQMTDTVQRVMCGTVNRDNLQERADAEEIADAIGALFTTSTKGEPQ